MRRQGRSPLKYTNCGVCISLEKKVCLLEESLISINIEDKLSFAVQTLGTKTHKKFCHVNIKEGVVWRLGRQIFAFYQSHCPNPLSTQLMAAVWSAPTWWAPIDIKWIVEFT